MTHQTVDADAFNVFEAAGWEKQAPGYDDFFGPITTRLVEPLLDAVPPVRQCAGRPRKRPIDLESRHAPDPP